MRIAILTEVFLPKIDGVVTRTLRHLEQLAELGHDVLIFATGDAPHEYAGFEVVHVPSLSFQPVYPEIKFGLITPVIPRRLAQFQPDVVHAINPMWTAGWSSLIASAQGLPLVGSFHTDVPEYTVRLNIPWAKPAAKWGLRTFHGRAQYNLVTSGPMMERAAQYGIPNIELWPKAVDTISFAPEKATADMRSRLTGGNPAAPLVIFVGRVSAEKSVERCLPIMETLRTRMPGARFALVGDGPQFKEIQRSFERDWITLTGYLSGEELHAAYASGDVLLFPSTTETLGFAALEAFASGAPVVAAEAGGLPFVVDDGLTGFLVDPSLPDSAWAKKLEQLLVDAPLRAQMSQAARTEAKRWNWRSSTEAVVNVYKKAIAAKAAG